MEGDCIKNAHVSENHIVLGCQQLENKGNKIAVILRLLVKSDIDSAIIPINAIGTKVNIAQAHT